ncbi:response regulator transcription factor [Paenibacillus roseipurpureus]|uniref:Response regulator n=1 Tax=Paenibacillus roseopurpureus TaxID=2918901 RepID=A0AA96LTK4_9BACL|nr:response regulator [Paenibacillus sp. MBLB1832]WNR46917.1 response regulator [Paenibacillus sp. MBLB1832]
MNRDLLTVLVVDDEVPLRQELRLFPWEANGLELVGEAENGEEALIFCRNFSPDIVLTDITMPVMDGLTMFSKLKEEFPLTQVILLTCHSDFAYARKALQLGATGYLVKVTMQEQELAEALNKAREAHDRARSIHRKESEDRRWQLSKEWVNLTNGSAVSEKEISEFFLSRFKLLMPLWLTAIHVESRKAYRPFVHREVEEMLTRLEWPKHPFHWLPAEDGVYVLLFSQESMTSISLRSQLETITSTLCDMVERQLPYLSGAVNIYAVVGEPVRKPEELREMYEFVTEEQTLRFYDQAVKVFIGGKASAAPLSSAAASQMAEKLRQTKGDRVKLVECLRNELTRWASKHRLPAEVLKNLVLEWRQLWVDVSAEGGIEKRVETANAMMEVRSLSELIAIAVHEIESGYGPKAKQRKEITAAQAYIEVHLDKPITLTQVAEHVELSSTYFSRLFREETGISYNDYVTRKRMERAVHLLQTTTMRVYEVAIAVGIPSYRYFTTTFREHAGASPTEFKRG